MKLFKNAAHVTFLIFTINIFCVPLLGIQDPTIALQLQKIDQFEQKLEKFKKFLIQRDKNLMRKTDALCVALLLLIPLSQPIAAIPFFVYGVLPEKTSDDQLKAFLANTLSEFEKLKLTDFAQGKLVHGEYEQQLRKLSSSDK